MSEVITDKDKEYEAREEANAPGADQAMSDRVNNRSLRPNSSAFIDFMKTGWDASEPEIEPLESSKFTPARLAALGKAFPGERLVIPAGSPKVRNNDCDYMFRPDTTFAYYTGLGQDYEAGAVLVLNPLDPDSPEAKAGKTHEAELFVAPRADTATQDFFMNAHYGEYWVGPRAGLKEMTSMTGIETHDIAQLADALSKDVGAEAGAVRVRVISDADPQVTSLVESIRESNGYTDPDKNNAADDKLHEFAAEARMVKDEYEIGEMRKAVQATKHGFDHILAKLPEALDKPRSERILAGLRYDHRLRRARADSALDAQHGRRAQGRHAAHRCRCGGQQPVHGRHHPHVPDQRQVHRFPAPALPGGAGLPAGRLRGRQAGRHVLRHPSRLHARDRAAPARLGAAAGGRRGIAVARRPAAPPLARLRRGAPPRT